jgi:folate-dependent phosphoribosylglycinamide formyltransferase PurN
MRFLLKKNATDDELIEALRRETGVLMKEKAVLQQREGGARQRAMKFHPGNHKSEERKRLEAELVRFHAQTLPAVLIMAGWLTD